MCQRCPTAEAEDLWGNCLSPHSATTLGVFYSERCKSKQQEFQNTIWGEGIKLEKSTSDCVSGGNNLESQFRSPTEKNQEDRNYLLRGISGLSRDPPGQNVKSLPMSLNSLTISVLPSFLALGQLFLVIGKSAGYSDHERKFRCKQKIWFRFAITLNEIIPR